MPKSLDTSSPSRARRNPTAGGLRLSSPRTSQVPGSTRVRILDAAAYLFAEQGYDGVSMPTIAKASGITAGAIYKHFEGKEELFFEVVKRAVQTAAITMDRSSDDATALSRVVAAYTTEQTRSLRQFAVEIHYASAKHPKVRRLLRRAVEGNIAQIRDSIAGQRRAGTSEPADSKFLASAVMVFVMGLMHMETLLPHLVGDHAWHDFVEKRISALLGTSGADRNVAKD